MKKFVAMILCTMILLAGCSTQAKSTKEAETSQEVSSEVTVQSSSAAKKDWWEIALTSSALEREENAIQNCFVYRNSDNVSAIASGAFGASGTDSDFSLLLNSATKATDIGEPLKELSFFEVLLADDTKYSGTFYEKGISFVQSLPGKEAEEPVLLEVNSDDYQALLTSLKNCFTAKKMMPSWLTLMRKSKSSSITLLPSDGKSEATFTPDMWQFNMAFLILRNFYIVPETSKSVDKTATIANATKIHIKFMNGVFYDVQCDGKTLIVASSDLPNAVQYSLDNTAISDSKGELDKLAAGALIPETGKPVIYLYPKETTQVSVKVNYKGQFTYTYPAYKDGWLVTADPDGRLINKADDTEHYYLYWEGTAYVGWNFDEGFVVRGEDTEQFLQGALKTMGLTPREYNDFIVYWLPEMQCNAYNLITFANEQYEAIAPLEITPKPDSVLRVHMVYKALQAPIEISKQKLTPFTRNGFTVVEWGGSRAQ